MLKQSVAEYVGMTVTFGLWTLKSVGIFLS